MPVALRRAPGRSRSRWFSNYVNLVIDKDVLDISRVRQREMPPRLLRQLAARSGQVLNVAAISGTIGLEKSTTENYTNLLEAVFLSYRLPAWGTTLGSRVIKHPKVHLVDSGVMAWLLNLTPEKIALAAPATLGTCWARRSSSNSPSCAADGWRRLRSSTDSALPYALAATATISPPRTSAATCRLMPGRCWRNGTRTPSASCTSTSRFAR